MDEESEHSEEEVDSNELWRDLVTKAAEVMVHFGLFNAVIDQYPPHVKEGLIERMVQLHEVLEKEVEIIQGFGEYFDESTE
jgi:hypothetical protein